MVRPPRPKCCSTSFLRSREITPGFRTLLRLCALKEVNAGGGCERAFADEKPGPQWTRPRDAPEPRAASTSAQLPPRTQPLGQPRRDPTRHALPQYESLGSQSFIEALGVHQAESKPGAAGNVIEVRVAPSTRPLVLVLSANTDVRWKLSLDSGAQLAAVFFSGSVGQTIVGVGAGVFIHDLGRTTAHAKADVAKLDRDVVEKLGRPIDKFQGSYQARSFFGRRFSASSPGAHGGQVWAGQQIDCGGSRSLPGAHCFDSNRHGRRACSAIAPAPGPRSSL